jgi:hypothetical protein
MAERHGALVIAYRRKLARRGFRDGDSPLPHYQPDIYSEKRNASDRITSVTVVEAEIESSLFLEHTATQLARMVRYLESPLGRKQRAVGILLVPDTVEARRSASWALRSQFPRGCNIRIDTERV